jgi:hypothetical protein
MWLRRLVLRVIVRSVILLGAMWFILRDVEGPADMLFPPAFQHQLKLTLVLFIVCGLILVFWRAVRVIIIHLRYGRKARSFAP